MVRKRRAAARAVRDDFEALVEQIFVPDGLQQPPHRFDIFIPKSDIRPVQVYPVANPFRQPLPILNAFESGFAAERVEFFNAVGFNLGFVGKTELLFHLNFHRQPMRIPAAAAVHVIPVHGFITREHVFKDSRQHVVNARLAIGGRRTLKKDIRRAVFAFIR